MQEFDKYENKMATEGRHGDLVHNEIQVEIMQDDNFDVQDDDITKNTDLALPNNQQSNVSGLDIRS